MMMEVNSKVAEIKALIEKKVLHPYLLEYIDVPVIDEDKLLLLVSTMEGLNLTDRERDNYALTTMLIQIALDTHEHVSNKQAGPGLKQRQLTVLAGDYYSGLYYKLLAESDDIMMIRSLSRGIKEVNEHKILFYQKDFDNISEILKSVKNIESSLLSRFSEFFGSEAWSPIIEGILLLKRLLKERSDFVQKGFSPFFEVLETVALNAEKESRLGKNQLMLDLLDDQLGRLKSEIEAKVALMPKMNLILKTRVDKLLGEINFTKICVEEG